jgi:protein TIF31
MTDASAEPGKEPDSQVPALEDEDKVEALGGQILKGLVILPPLQKSGTVAKEDAVPLPPIRVEEPVSSIRQALSDVCGYAHLTNFRFALEDPPKTTPTVNMERPTISPYTGRDAVVSVPVAVKSLAQEATALLEPTGALDDYGDLRAMLPQGIQDGSGIRIVLERYDVALIKDHIIRLRSLLDGNAPSTISLDEGAEARGKPDSAEETPAEGKDKGGNDKDSATKQKEQNGEEKTNSKEEAVEPQKNIPIFPADKTVAADTSNLKDFFYLACGEDPSLYAEDVNNMPSQPKKENSLKSKKKNKKGKEKSNLKDEGGEKEEVDLEIPKEQLMRETIPKLNALEEKTRVECTVNFSGFHPPPPGRRLMGDLAYLKVTPPGATEPIHVTAIPTGFYVNRSSSKGNKPNFDPAPAAQPYFAHELLDCLLQCSESLRESWEEALAASKTRAELTARLNEDGPFQSLFRVAIRGDFSGYSSPATAAASEGIDALIQSPSWLVPIPEAGSKEEDSWTRNGSHLYNTSRTEDALANNFGIDIRSGTLRDWNEELQSAREMSTVSLPERIERARVIYKVLNDFGEAALLGVKAIWEGQIGPMNPNEPTRSQVYLHNNIFFSRAVDAGVETFKIAKGDRAARKSASRDVHCLGVMHRMERIRLYTLATVLVDYLGTRYVCQSILPGILSGEKTHTLLYGAVEAGSPLMWDKEMHELLEDTLGKSLMIATRPLPREPLSPERVKEIEAAKARLPFPIEKKEEETKDESLGTTIEACAPIEAKGIRGSDQRNYVLDMTRLTPRDANWIPASKGGTGNWESMIKEDGKSGHVPKDIEDDEWTLAVLRSELVTNYAQVLMSRYINEKKEKEAKEAEKEATDGDSDAKDSKADDGKTEPEKKEEEKKKALTEEDMEYLKSLRFNVNVFLPDINSLESIDAAAYKQIQKDEEMARNAAKFLWDETLPRITRMIREGSWHQVPHDGKGLTELLHQHGVNCRYLGRLATLAQVEEETDHKREEILKQSGKFDRRIMSHYWLELLECEIVARAAKHVLDRYLTESGGTAALNPAQTVASFLSAIVSDGEETAAQTEKRMGKRETSEPDEDDFNGLTFYDGGGEGDAVVRSVRGRFDVWKDIEAEVGRRFRYTLTLYNRQGKKPRARYPSLLRRVCQRTGVRLAAKSYPLGAKCLCSLGGFGGQMMPSYPISPVDVIDIVPLMKHAAAHGEGFVPCGLGAATGLPPLHISLPDVRATLEAAHIQHSGRALSRALDLAQEACSLYQRVTEAPAHPGVVRCLDLMASILFDAGEPAHGASNALKGLGLAVQIGGFDSPEVIGTHLIIFQMLVTAGVLPRAIKHLRAAIYLMELLGGPNHVEISNAYHKAGTVYHGIGDMETALKFYEEAASRQSADRLLEGMIFKSKSTVLAGLQKFKQAVDTEKRAYQMFSVILGENHQLTRTSDVNLKKLMGAAIQYGSKMVEDAKKEEEEAAALAIAQEMAAEEAAEEEKKNKNKKKKKKGKK